MGKYQCVDCEKVFNGKSKVRKLPKVDKYRCRSCIKKRMEPKITWYLPENLEQVTFQSGGKLIGVHHKGEFVALNKIRDSLLVPFKKSAEFVRHIRRHINKDRKLKGQKVICKFCDKTIDEIWDVKKK